MWRWVFGDDLRVEGASDIIGPRLFDIEVVEGVVALMRLQLQRFADPSRPEVAPEDQDIEIRITVRPPVQPGSEASEMTREILLTDLPGLSSPERRRLVVSGAGAYVSFTSGWRPEVVARDLAFRRDISTYLRVEGRRLVPWWKALAGLPAVASIALVGLWIAELVLGKLDGILIAFGSILTAGALGGGAAASAWLVRRGARQVLTHRFRAASRAEFRAAVLSVKSGLLTTGVGTLLGVILTVLFYGVTGIDPA